jgi:RsiW-degrading membrane proteinase PrsW (M82 family)
MNSQKWYYTQDDKVFGPFTRDSLDQMANAGIITTGTLVALEGNQDWQELRTLGEIQIPQQAAQNGGNVFSGFAGKVSQASGLEKLEGFSIGALFSQVFKKHTPEEIEEHFIAGTAQTTPALKDVTADWPTPWAFVRLLGMSMLASVGFYYALARFSNPNLIPGWIFVGCFGIPFAVLVFFMEANILRNVSFYRTLTLMFLGGLISLIISLFLFEYTQLGAWMGAMSAGLIEEAGKLLAVIYFTRKWTKYGWTLNGLLFGAAVGTGFSAFESAGYVFVALIQGFLTDPNGVQSEATMFMRAFLAPFTHTIWTAATAAALWRVKGDKKFEWSMLADFRFLRIFIIIVGLHMAWNSPLTVPVVGGMTGFLGFRLLLGIIGWIIILSLMQSGIKEVRTAKAAAVDSVD